MNKKPKIELQVDEVKDVWVAWTNTDLTEGRGEKLSAAIEWMLGGER